MSPNNQQRFKGSRDGGGRSTGRTPAGCTQQSSARGGSRPYVRNGQPTRITCFRCGGPNHKADTCCATDEEAEQYQAFLVQTGDTTDETWFPDTGANNHMTPTTTDAQGPEDEICVV
ncbi:hypothetical protein F2P56_004791 [Juglans regia]|uniref:CCHC-type domain-containing protein n=2 Tax=Juglans regia TaxID=51240 RepID=A0A834D619_JUGRE|nr:uncharacterized protein LOC109014505 [Juglans regia]KAF5478210.1 hypothetical protein F2P56_004791 [Juglans regia]